MTGITRVSKESIFSDLKHLKVVTTTSREYATSFGFTQEEEKNLEETLQAALNQIEEKQYEADLIAGGILVENIKKYGFAFEGKKVLIGEG